MDGKRYSLRAAAALAALLLLTAGCGGGESTETVYLHVFNAYPGSSSLSLYGPTGTVASNLGFGQRTGDYQSVDRNLGTNFELVLQGAPTSFDLSLPLYDLYPQESATVFFKRRTGEDTVDDPLLFRHIQTGYTPSDKQCRLVLDNALSVQNDAIAQFNYVPLFKLRPSCSGYVDQIGSFKDTGLKVQTQGGETIQVGRPGLYQRIKENPWFIPTDMDDGEVLDVRNVRSGNCKTYDSTPQDNQNKRGQIVAGDKTFGFTWAFDAEIEYESGSFRGIAPTRQYMKCIGWDPDKPPGRQKIKSEQVLECQRSEATAKSVKLTNETVSYYFPTGIGLGEGNNKINGNQCGFRIQMTSDFFNIFDEPEGKKPRAVKSTIKFKPSQYFFWVLYGRPVNPKIEQWGANTPERGGGFVKLPPYPGE